MYTATIHTDPDNKIQAGALTHLFPQLCDRLKELGFKDVLSLTDVYQLSSKSGYKSKRVKAWLDVFSITHLKDQAVKASSTPPSPFCEVCLVQFLPVECGKPRVYVGCRHLFHEACTYGSNTCPCCTFVQVPMVVLHRVRSSQAILNKIVA
jgi:hypothetical protein